MDNLVVLNNEKVSNENGKFYSRNYNFKILPEGLNEHFKVEYIVRNSNVKENHEFVVCLHFPNFIWSIFKRTNF